MPLNMVKLPTGKSDLFLRVVKGHFATSHSHINYYIDITMQKTRLSEAKAVARELVSEYRMKAVVDTILCLDGMEIIGTCLAEGLTKEDFINMNAHRTIYIIKPEHTSDSQLLFRDNIVPMLAGKHVLVLAASVATGGTARAAFDAVHYYGGHVAGIASVFSTLTECEGYPVTSIFNTKDLPDYTSCDSHKCPMCKEGQKIEALVNSYGYSKL